MNKSILKSSLNFSCRLRCIPKRVLSDFNKPTSSQPEVFDRQLKLRQRHFNYNISHDNNEIDYYDYIRKEITQRLADRIFDINRSFPLVLEIGSHRRYFLEIINESNEITGNDNPMGGIRSLIQTDSVPVKQKQEITDINTTSNSISVNHMLCDEENLPFPPESFDMVFCPFTIHWINNIPSFLKQVKDILRPDGVFLGAILGGTTLEELKHCFYLAEIERKGGIGMHASPYVLPSDVAGLMQGAGFSLPTIDIDHFQISYPNAISLMEHLQRMGEGNASLSRQLHVGKDTMLAMAAIYQDMYGLEDGSITANFQVIYVIGWHPHESQQKPCQRGSAEKSFKDISS